MKLILANKDVSLRVDTKRNLVYISIKDTFLFVWLVPKRSKKVQLLFKDANSDGMDASKIIGKYTINIKLNTKYDYLRVDTENVAVDITIVKGLLQVAHVGKIPEEDQIDIGYAEDVWELFEDDEFNELEDDEFQELMDKIYELKAE